MADANYLEGTQITLRPKTRPPNANEVTYTVKKTVGDQTTTVTAKKGINETYTYDCANVDAGHDFYEISYTTQVDDQEPVDGQTFKVWVANLKVTFKIVATDGSPTDQDGVQSVPYSIKLGNGLSLADLSATPGQAKRSSVVAGRAKVAVPSPFEIKKVVKGKGREREYEVCRHFEAKILRPRPDKPPPKKADGTNDTAKLRQFVNLETQMKGIDRKGSVIEVVVVGKGDKDRQPDERRAREGDVLHVKLEMARETKPKALLSTPPPGLETDDLVEDAPTSSNEGWTQTATVLVDANGQAVFRIDVGHVGGDLLTLHVGPTSEATDDRVSIRVWRQLYYQISAPPHIFPPEMTKIKERLRKVWIECESAQLAGTKDKVFRIDGMLDDKASWVRDVGYENTPALIVGSHNRDKFHKEYFHPPDGTVGRCMHFLFADAQVDPSSYTVESATLLVRQACKIPWPPPAMADAIAKFPDPTRNAEGNDVTYGVCLRGTDLGIGGPIYPIALETGKPAVTASYKEPDWWTWATIPEDHCVVRYDAKYARKASTTAEKAERFGRVYVRLPQEANKALLNGKAIKFSITIYYGSGPWCGEAHSDVLHWLVLSTEYDFDENVDTVIHEAGHALNMAVSPGISVPGKTLQQLRTAHGKWYEKNGNHCGENTATKCVMFESGGKSDGSKFCEKCGTLLAVSALPEFEE